MKSPGLFFFVRRKCRIVSDAFFVPPRAGGKKKPPDSFGTREILPNRPEAPPAAPGAAPRGASRGPKKSSGFPGLLFIMLPINKMSLFDD